MVLLGGNKVIRVLFIKKKVSKVIKEMCDIKGMGYKFEIN